MRSRFPAPSAIVAFAALAAPLWGGAPATREEALAAAYPGAEIRAERLFLTDAERREASALAGVELASSLVARYIAVRDGKLVGRAYVDTHVVRTKNESLLVMLDAAGAIRRIEVTAFLEPPEYRASAAWYGQFEGRKLTDDLRVERAIRPLAGATLTAAAATAAARRALALDRVVRR